MKWALPLLVLVSPAPAFAVAVGDSYDRVLADKGKPAGVVAAGSVRVLTYADAIIKVKDGIVVSIRVPDKERAFVLTPTPPHPPAPTAPPPAYDGPAEWGSDLKAAIGQARSRHCPILILFTGSDWSAESVRMDDEVYSRPEFAAYTRDKFVLLKLDFPTHTPEADDLRLLDRRIANHYQVKGYPMAIIVDSNGVALGRLEGFHEGGPGGFIGWAKQFEPGSPHP